MIKDFWKDRKEEKKRLKELKKQNKKLPASREQRAYKIFGVCFAFFLIFGCIFRACSGSSDTSGFSWESIIGITDEMKDRLEAPVSKKDLLFDKQIDIVDWSYCKDILINSGVGSVIVDNQINMLDVVGKTVTITSPISLDSRMLGALSQKMIENSLYGGDVELVEVMLEMVDDKLIMKSLVRLNLSTVVLSNNLPSVYVTTTSTVHILNKEMFALDSSCRINNLEESDNDAIIELINKNSLSDIEFYTNELIARKINDFAEGVGAKVRINNSNIELY